MSTPEKADILQKIKAQTEKRRADMKTEQEKSEREKTQGKEKPKPPEIFSASDLELMTIPPIKWIIPKLMPSGQAILGGRPKIGKSWFALNLAVAVACGGKALGSIDVEPGRVLYLCLEDSKRRIKDRLNQVMQGAPFPKNLCLSNEWPRLDKGAATFIANWIEENPDNARLVIIDTLKKIRMGSYGGRSQYDTDYEQLGELKAIADRYNVCNLALHHTTKAKSISGDIFDELSGSYGLSGCADTLYMITRSRGASDLELHIRGRDLDDNCLALSISKEGIYSLLGDAAEYRTSKERSEIIGILRESSAPLKSKEIADSLGMPSDKVRYKLSRMQKRGEVINKDGEYSLPPTTF